LQFFSINNMDSKEFFQALIDKNIDKFDKNTFLIIILFYFIVSFFASDNIFFQYFAIMGMNFVTFIIKSKFDFNQNRIIYYTFFPALLTVFLEQIATNYIPIPEKARTSVRFVLNAALIALL
jgi:hypothetical protein